MYKIYARNGVKFCFGLYTRRRKQTFLVILTCLMYFNVSIYIFNVEQKYIVEQ
jgi:hypothetical protein